MTEIIVADIGGTHARFAIAAIGMGVTITLGHQVTMKSADYASLQLAWEAYGREIGRDLPPDAAIAVAGRVGEDIIRFSNSDWILRPALIAEQLGLNRFTLVNDFGAVGHAVAMLDEGMFGHICGPEKPVPDKGVISIIGPGTGLGAAQLLRDGDHYHVTETEGGHMDFAPHDDIEDMLLRHLRQKHDRVSVERVVSGPGLKAIYDLLAGMKGVSTKPLNDNELWHLALTNADSLAAKALERFCLCLGSVVGDLALAQGAEMVVMAGGLGRRIADKLPSSGFQERFVAKGRFESMMKQIPVKQLLYEEPGLYGAAVAFMREHAR